MASTEIKPRSIITEQFRVENAKKFVQCFRSRPYTGDFGDNAQYESNWASKLEGNEDVFYMSIGRIVPWIYSEYIDSQIPEPSSTWLDITHVWSSMLTVKKVQSNDIIHVIPRENWSDDNESYPYYSSISSNTETYDDRDSENFYVIDEDEFRVYKCLWNNYGVKSDARPSSIGEADVTLKTQKEPFTTSDGYIWKYMYTIEPAETLKFVTDNFLPVRKDRVNDDNTSEDGAIYKIAIIGKEVEDISQDPREITYLPPSGDTEGFRRIRIDGLYSDSSDVSEGSDYIDINIDLTNSDNADRIASSETDDMVGYQIEHVMDDDGRKSVEIGRIVSSQVNYDGDTRQELQLQVERIDDEDESMFTVLEDASESGNNLDERWFLSPLVEIYGSGKNASAMVLLEDESNSDAYNTTSYEFYPEDNVQTGPIVDVHMNTYGSGYRNIYYRSSDDDDLHSLVVIRQGKAQIGEGLTDESESVPSDDRNIEDFVRIVSITPLGGHSTDNVLELYGWNVMINQTFEGKEDSFATIVNDFRQVALIQNPMTQSGTLASDGKFRQSVRLEFDGDLTSGDDAIQVDDEIMDVNDRNEMKKLFGYVSDWSYDSDEDKTLVYLSTTFGFLERSADDVYNINDDHQMYITFRGETGEELSGEDAIALDLSSRITDEGSDGEFQKSLGSSSELLETFSGQMMYIENRLPISRSEDQSENVKLIIEY